MAQYFDNVELKSKIKEIIVNIFNLKFSFYSDYGVFSKDKLDYGTRLLLQNIDYQNLNGDVLDLGCGIGPIGIIVKKITNCNVTMCDINKRAVHLSLMNAKKNNVSVEILESDCYQNINKMYDTIITNPPIRAGKKIVYTMLFDAKKYLKNNGCLYLVIHKDQGAKSLVKDLEKEYEVSILTKDKGFFVIKCKMC